MAPTMGNEIDRGGTSFPALPHRTKIPNISRTYILTFKILEEQKSLNSYSLFLLNNSLSKISSTWKYISSNRDRTVLTFEEPVEEIAQKFITTTELELKPDLVIKVKFEMHNFMNKVKGTVFAMELVSLSDAEILEELRGQGVIEIYRFMKRNAQGTAFPSGLFALTFQGNVRPNDIRIAYLKLEVKPSYQNPLQCKHCLKFGHNKFNCNGADKPPACSNCGIMVEHEDCQANCINCQGAHKPTDRNCPIYRQEREIIVIKTDQNLSFPEARRRIIGRRGTSSYAEAASQSELISTIQILKTEMKHVSETNSKLTLAMKEQSEEIIKLRDEKNNSESREIINQIQVFKDQMNEMSTQHNILIAELRSNHRSDLEKIREEAKINENKLLAEIKSLKSTNQSLLTTVRIHQVPAAPTPSVPAVQKVIPDVISSGDDDLMEVENEQVKGQRRAAKEQFTRLGNKKPKKNPGSSESNKK